MSNHNFLTIKLMRLPKLSTLALSLGLIFAGQVAQAQTSDPGTGGPGSDAGNDARGSCKSTTICFTKRWIFVGNANLGGSRLEQNIYFKKLSELVNNAKTWGYNGIAIGSKGFGALLAETPDNDHRYYQENLEALVKLAEEKGVDLIPVGASPDLPLIRNNSKQGVDLIEAVPVKPQTFVVNGQEARLKEPATPLLNDGDFAISDAGWAVMPGNVNGPVTLIIDKVDRDPSNLNNPKSAKFITTTGGSGTGYARLIRSFWGLDKHTAYRVSFWVKTSNFNTKDPTKVNHLYFQAFSLNSDPKGNPLYVNASSPAGWGTDANGEWNGEANVINGTQGWTQYNLDINTLNAKDIAIQFRVSNAPAADGALWLDDVQIREVGLPHPVRRDTLPFTVTSPNGSTKYTEHVDYKVAPEKLVIIPTGAIKNGQELLVTSFQSAKQFMSAYTTPASACSPAYFKEQGDIYDKISKLFKNSSDFFIYHDEWRVMNWDPACNTGTAGAYLARTTRTLLDTFHSIKPMNMYIWNDMYDPKHNAKKEYFAVNGDLTDVLNKENGLTPDPTFTIMNWIEENQVDSLKNFSEHGFKQMIALDYGDDKNLTKTRKWLASLSAADTQGVKKVEGFMYTTWIDIKDGDDYGRLQDVAKLIQDNYKPYWPTQKVPLSQ
ncbi:hypothetical protein GTP81_13590 [Rugamonas sp. FT107W]|uniref:GH26 domain-containing protein n=1 Tax=Duganella vulcania TaxID=2692166 RepID=A0A845HG63_9BURK|nr:hypothetical protein [Duganella vulcania]MYN17790.1 hypothetical protein [Duganella vulcania]